MQKIIGLCVEPGNLEFQALLCVKTIRKFGKLSDKDKIIIISPRGRKLSQKGHNLLIEENCEIYVENLNIKHSNMNLANKPYAAEWIALQNPGSNFLFLDCDTLITNNLKPLFEISYINRKCIINRPVWSGGFSKTPGSYGKDDPNDKNWIDAYKAVGADISKCALINVPWSSKNIRGYWNSGVLLTKEINFYKEWKICFETLFYKNIYKSLLNINYFEQFACSIAIAKAQLNCITDAASNLGLEQICATAEKPRIIHYAGESKKTILQIAQDIHTKKTIPIINKFDEIDTSLREIVKTTFMHFNSNAK